MQTKINWDEFNKMQTKKDIHKIGLHLLGLFKRMDWIHYLEKKNFTSNNLKIYRLIHFKYKNNFILEFALTKIEYQYWRSIKPKLIKQKIGDKI